MLIVCISGYNYLIHIKVQEASRSTVSPHLLLIFIVVCVVYINEHRCSVISGYNVGQRPIRVVEISSSR